MLRARTTALGAAIVSVINRKEPKFQDGDRDSIIAVLIALEEVTTVATAHAERYRPPITGPASPQPDPAASPSGNKAP